MKQLPLMVRLLKVLTIPKVAELWGWQIVKTQSLSSSPATESLERMELLPDLVAALT